MPRLPSVEWYTNRADRTACAASCSLRSTSLLTLGWHTGCQSATTRTRCLRWVPLPIARRKWCVPAVMSPSGLIRSIRVDLRSRVRPSSPPPPSPLQSTLNGDVRSEGPYGQSEGRRASRSLPAAQRQHGHTRRHAMSHAGAPAPAPAPAGLFPLGAECGHPGGWQRPLIMPLPVFDDAGRGRSVHHGLGCASQAPGAL
jgi:hypothetical protein